MIPSIVSRQVSKGTKSFLENIFSPSSKSFLTAIKRFTTEEDNIFKGPFVSYDMPFNASDSEHEYFPDVPMGFKPHMHQFRSFERIGASEPLSTIIATGTGSGKTECFTLPILNYCYQRRGEKGIKAILIYPMNALASDQAKRLAEVVFSNDKLKGNVRVGLYADTEPRDPNYHMSETEVITAREELRQNPPDILITNYKMLDYLLVRPKDKLLWTKNEPETLRYLVVDELHTFDGAQGTDLACLIRRLKGYLKAPEDHICCIGTSATLGGGDDTGGDPVKDISEYATQVFGEKFDNTSVVVEDRQTLGEYLQNYDIDYLDIPKREDLITLLDEADQVGTEEFIEKAYTLWFGSNPARHVLDDDWRVDLGNRLNSHLFMHDMLKVLSGKPQAIKMIRQHFTTKPFIRDKDSQYLDGLVDSFSALVSHARKRIGNSSKTFPFLNVRYQLWLRELKRLVASVSDDCLKSENDEDETLPSLKFSDDVAPEELNQHAPMLYCRDCGGSGWAVIIGERGNKIKTSLEEVYKHFFARSDNLYFLLLDKPEVKTRREHTVTNKVHVCARELHYTREQDFNGHSCSSCSAGSDELFTAYLHQPRYIRNERMTVTHDCPFCARSDGMSIVGAQSATLLSSMVGSVFGSNFNDDPKLLAFSDSVQDAAHRAGFFEARSFKTIFKTALYQYLVTNAGLININNLMEEFPKYLKDQGEESFVAKYSPQDQQWRHDYQDLLRTGELPSGSRYPEMLLDRLSWEAYSEISLRTLDGPSLEKAGLIATHVDADVLRQAAEYMAERAGEELSSLFAEIKEETFYHFLFGVIERMRYRGAILTDATNVYLNAGANWFGFLRSTGRHNLYPTLARRAPHPTFPATQRAEHYDHFSEAGSVRPWYTQWADKYFIHDNVLASSDYQELYYLTFKALENAGLVTKREMGGSHAHNSCWGLNNNSVYINSNIEPLRCTHCGYKSQVSAANHESLDGIKML